MNRAARRGARRASEVLLMASQLEQVFRYDTVLLAETKEIQIKINYLYVIKSPLEQKFHVDSKASLKKLHTIQKRHKFLIKFLVGNEHTQF